MQSSSTNQLHLKPLNASDYGLYVVLVLSWSASWYALALQVGDVAVPTSLFWRFAIAASVMWVWVLLSKQRQKNTKTSKSLLDPEKPNASAVGSKLSLHAAFAGMGLFIFCLNFTLFYYGSAYLISGLLSVVFSLASVFSLVLGFLITRAVPAPRVMLGAILGFAGIAFMFWPEIAGQSWNGAGAIGLALCVGGTLSFCTGSQISAALQRKNIPVLAASAWGMTYGATFSCIISLASGNSLAPIFTPVYIGSLLFLAIISSVVAFWSYLTLIGRIGAGRAGYATVVFPVLALLISTVMEDYSFQPVALVGLLLVLAGNILVLGNSRKKNAKDRQSVDA